MPEDMAGWDMRCAAAARVNVPCSAIDSRMRRCRGSISIIEFYRLAHILLFDATGSVSVNFPQNGSTRGRAIWKLAKWQVATSISSAACRCEHRRGLREGQCRIRSAHPRIPDGEVGERVDWVIHLERLFRDNPDFERSDEVFSVHAGATKRHRYRLKAGRGCARGDIRQSRIRRQCPCFLRRVRAPARGGHDCSRHPISGRSRTGAFGAVAVRGGGSAICARCGLQRRRRCASSTRSRRRFRTATSRSSSTSPRPCSHGWNVASRRFMAARRRRCWSGSAPSLLILPIDVPAGVELLFHFCYGDANHRHVVEPTDMGDMVEMANPARRQGREADRADPYAGAARPFGRGLFLAVARLALAPETKLALGLVHYTDGSKAPGAAWTPPADSSRDYAVATECGFGRRAPETIPALLRLHLAAADYA